MAFVCGVATLPTARVRADLPMPGEYLIFNLLVLAGPLGLSFWHRTKFVHLWPLAFLAVALPGVPYLVWDALVTGRHWEFN